MREVGCEDGSLATLGVGVSKLNLGKAQASGTLRAMRCSGGLLRGVDLSPMGKAVNKFPMANLVARDRGLIDVACQGFRRFRGLFGNHLGNL
jgi:hypothetical protein